MFQSKTPGSVAKELAVRLKKHRSLAGLTQVQLAKQSGVSYASLKRFETTGLISLESLLKIIAVLGRLDDFDLVLSLPKEGGLDALFSNKTR